MNEFELKEKFTEEFFEDFQYNAEFRNLFISMTQGLTPYKVIEHLCKSKKELYRSIQRALEDMPKRYGEI